MQLRWWVIHCNQTSLSSGRLYLCPHNYVLSEILCAIALNARCIKTQGILVVERSMSWTSQVSLLSQAGQVSLLGPASLVSFLSL